jgi:hypothetical protein
MLFNCKISFNFKKNPIFLNGAIQRSGVDSRPIDCEFFGTDFYHKNMSAIRKLTYADCFTGDKFKSINEFTDLGLRFSVSVWMRLRSSLLFTRKQLSGSTPLISLAATLPKY